MTWTTIMTATWTSAQDTDDRELGQCSTTSLFEEGYGYPTDVVFGDGCCLWRYDSFAAGPCAEAKRNVNMEIWLPNQEEAWLEATARWRP